MPDPLKLFISYRSSDAPKVDKIAGDLALLKHEDGTPRYKPWQDKHNLPPASPHWWDAIVDAVIDSKVFVFHISQDSLKSVVCQAELDYAHQRNRPIIPIVLDGEFFLDPQSGKYNLPKETWALVPTWLGERQFLFYMGADFYRQFEMAMDVFRREWPRDVYAPRPMDPATSSNQTRNYVLYDQACDYAERLAFAEAEKLFDVLVRRNDRDFGATAAEWLELLRRYAELIEIDALPRLRFRFKPRWEEYAALFPKDFLEGLFDPKGFAAKSTTPPLSRVESPPAPKSMTAAEYYNRAYDFADTGDHDRAIADYTEAIRLDLQDAAAYNNRGLSYKAKGEYDRAIADYTEAIRINPQFANAYYNRGVSYKAKGEIDRAIADYNETTRLNPQDADPYVGRGVSYYAKGEYDRAIADYTEAIRLNPQYVIAYSNRGNIYNDIKKDPNRAIADYNEAIRLNPQYANAYSGRGNVYYAKKDYDHAIADYDRALQIDPNHATATDNRKLALDEKKKQGR